MTRWSKPVISATFAIGLLLIGPVCGLSYLAFAGGPYKGRVIDSETKQPLEGAVVLAVWVRWIPAFVTSVESFLDAEEVLTDRDGTFVVGKKRPMSWIPAAPVEGPRITIFYPGYGFYPNYHTNPPLPPAGTEGLLDQMEKEGLTFELPCLKMKEERIKVVQDLALLTFVPREKMQNLIRLLNVERKATGLPPV